MRIQQAEEAFCPLRQLRQVAFEALSERVEQRLYVPLFECIM